VGFGARRNSALLAVVLDNITQGVVMFDAAERLVVCNDRYIEMYGLSRDVVKPGCSFLDVINNRRQPATSTSMLRNIVPRFSPP